MITTSVILAYPFKLVLNKWILGDPVFRGERVWSPLAVTDNLILKRSHYNEAKVLLYVKEEILFSEHLTVYFTFSV